MVLSQGMQRGKGEHPAPDSGSMLQGSHLISAFFIFPLRGAGYNSSLFSKVAQSLINLERRNGLIANNRERVGKAPAL